jgi:anti-anti-sigma regulatory factor
MTLKIEKHSDGQKTIIRLSGRIQSEHLDQLKTQIENDHSGIALDLHAVTLVDVEVVRFLNTFEEIGIELHHC